MTTVTTVSLQEKEAPSPGTGGANDTDIVGIVVGGAVGVTLGILLTIAAVYYRSCYASKPSQDPVLPMESSSDSVANPAGGEAPQEEEPSWRGDNAPSRVVAPGSTSSPRPEPEQTQPPSQLGMYQGR